MLSILVNPVLFLILDRLKPRLEGGPDVPDVRPSPATPRAAPPDAPGQKGHVVVVGHGRVGSLVAKEILRSGTSLFVIDERDEVIAGLRANGIAGVSGSARAVFDPANLVDAKALVVAIPEVFEAGQIVEQARAANPRLIIVARGHSDAEAMHLMQCGASAVVQGAEAIAHAMVEQYRGHVART